MNKQDLERELNERSHQRSASVVGGVADETGLTLAELAAKAPFHVYRLLINPDVDRDSGRVTVISGGNRYVFTDHQFEVIERSAARVRTEIMQREGLTLPLNVEDTVRVISEAMNVTRVECSVPDHQLRVMYLRMDDSGCGFYRVIQPVAWMQKREREMEGYPLHVEETNFLSYRMGTHLDVIVAPRMSSPQSIGVIKALQRVKKLAVYESDDLLSDLPSWNPAKAKISPEMAERREFFMRQADAVIVSTEELAEAMKRENMYVAHNGISPELWPMRIAEQNTPVVRIMWAGSATHEADLNLIVRPLKRLIKKWGSKLEIVFIGYAPDAFVEADRRNGERIRSEFERNVRFVGGCTMQRWPKHCAGVQPNIVIAPLVQHPFNEAKSELKIIEAWALGVPVVASNIAPYRRAITDTQDGFLCTGDDSWEVRLDQLIASAELRVRMAVAGMTTLMDRYTMDKIVLQTERALIKIALGKVSRPACEKAMREHLERIGG